MVHPGSASFTPVLLENSLISEADIALGSINSIMQPLALLAITALLSSAAAHTFAQSPDAALQSIPQEQQAWVHQSCPTSLGPSLWSACVNREVRALKGALPDLSNLSESDRNWALTSCPTSLGPSLTISCLSRELRALTSGMPKLDKLGDEKRAWLQQSCPQSLGPSLYKACAEREVRALASGAKPPQAQPHPPTIQAVPQSRARASGRSRADVYTIETSHNDEVFIINGEKFEAKTYCFNMEEDDEVIFLDGSPFGACASATLLNLRTREKCEAWCE